MANQDLFSNFNPLSQMSQPSSSGSRFSFTEQERQFYEAMYTRVDPSNSGVIQGREGVAFLQKSGLSNQLLKDIWILAAKSNPRQLNKEEFFAALKLVAAAQKGLPPTEAALRENVGLPNMGQGMTGGQSKEQVLEQMRKSPWFISEEDKVKYGKFFDAYDPHKTGMVSMGVVKKLFDQTQLGEDKLAKVEHIVNPQKSATFTRPMFMMALKLLWNAKQGHQIPTQLPQEFMVSLDVQRFLNQEELLAGGASPDRTRSKSLAPLKGTPTSKEKKKVMFADDLLDTGAPPTLSQKNSMTQFMQDQRQPQLGNVNKASNQEQERAIAQLQEMEQRFHDLQAKIMEQKRQIEEQVGENQQLNQQLQSKLHALRTYRNQYDSVVQERLEVVNDVYKTTSQYYGDYKQNSQLAIDNGGQEYQDYNAGSGGGGFNFF